MVDDPRSTEDLIRAALEGDDEDEGALAATYALQRRGTRDVLDAAVRLLQQPSARARARGADILGQLGTRNPVFETERSEALLALLREEQEPWVLLAAGLAVGHMGLLGALEALLRMSRHPSAEARLGAVHGLSRLDAPESVDALIRLSADEDRDVRNWATFGLGSMLEHVDTPQLRDALVARLGEQDTEIFGEALVGLAERKDARAIGPVRAALGASGVTVYVLEAAAALREPDFLPLLLRLRDSEGPADSYFLHVLGDVIARYEQA